MTDIECKDNEEGYATVRFNDNSKVDDKCRIPVSFALDILNNNIDIPQPGILVHFGSNDCLYAVPMLKWPGDVSHKF